ncbi:MAG: hypothetical protein E7292_10445 [Lachnospiraceae bacterium]|nr:hypothetical protein [Lachnospiraceae bacterium]
MDIYASYNWNKIKERLKDIEQTIVGLNTPVSKMVGNENGQITDEKVKEFANAVISHQCFLNGEYIGISGTHKRYFELLFYLIFRAYNPQFRVHNFADLLRVAEEMKDIYKNREELILREAGLIGGPLGFFEEIHESCKLLTGRSLADDWTEDELTQMKEAYLLKAEVAKQKAEEEQNLFACAEDEKIALWKKYESYGIEGDVSYGDALDNWYWYTYGLPIPEDETGDVYTFEDEMARREALFEDGNKPEKVQESPFLRRVERLRHAEEYAAKAEPWKNTFENPQEYLDAYREFSELHFYVNIITSEPSLEDSVLHILEQEGYNRVGDDARVVSLYAELNRALRIAKRKI